MPRTSSGDPAATIRLLWRHRLPAGAHRGPRRRLSVDDVVAAAISLADAEGLETVVMRRLAADLGVAPMTLYTYVPGRSELIDLMVDDCYQRMPRTALTGLEWRDRVLRIAHDNRDLMLAHPWLTEVSTQRPVLGPGVMAKYDHELSALDGLGLGDVELDAALTLVISFVRAATQDAVAARSSAASGSDQAWWQEAGPALAAVMDPAEFPLAARVGQAAGEHQQSALDPELSWSFGLARLLDGLEALVRGDEGFKE